VVEGLQAGANDYIRKPFGKLELLARIQTALKGPAEQTPQMQCGELLIRLDQRRVMFGDQEIEMKRREFDVLSYFVQHFDAVVTRETLITALNKESEIFDRTIDAHVSHVRARLKKAGVTSLQISSIYGVGYRLEKK
jgi:DNA-binding response OmpR family regulator